MIDQKMELIGAVGALLGLVALFAVLVLSPYGIWNDKYCYTFAGGGKAPCYWTRAECERAQAGEQASIGESCRSFDENPIRALFRTK